MIINDKNDILTGTELKNIIEKKYIYMYIYKKASLIQMNGEVKGRERGEKNWKREQSLSTLLYSM